MPIIDKNTSQVFYKIVRYEFSNKNDSIKEEKFNLVLKCRKRRSPLNNKIRTCPELVWQ